MKLWHRNTFEKRFEGAVTVQKICMYATVLEDQFGWRLDVSVHTDGIEIDSSGITVHFVKLSEKPETISADDEFLISADIALDLLRQEKANKRAKTNKGAV